MQLGKVFVDQSIEVQKMPGATVAASRKVWNLAPLVKNWVKVPLDNNGIALLAPSPQNQIFYSREGADAEFRPKLVITYAPGS